MTVTVTDNFTDVDDADQTTGWTSTLGGLATATLSPREAATYLQDQASQESFAIYHTISSTDLSAHTIFSWMRNSGPNTKANGGMRILLGDGTDRIAYYVGGSDDFGHFVLGWSMFKMDTTILPGNFEVLTGVEANLTTTAIVDVGMGGQFPGKAAGNADNVFVDILRYIANGSAALSISGGTTGARGTWAEIVVEDFSTSADAAFGILRTLVAGSKAYELNYGIEFGAATGDTFFDDSDFQLIIAGTDMAAGNMDVDLVAGTGTNLFALTNFVIIGIGAISNWDLSALFETMSLNDGQFVDIGAISFPVTGGTLRECQTTLFVNCGQVDPSTMTFKFNSFIGSLDADGALLWPSSVTNLSDLDFVSDGSGHAIEALNTGTFDYTNITDSGYTGTRGSNLVSSSGSIDAMFFNNSGGLITLTVVGGQSPSVRNGVDATTVVIDSVILKTTFTNQVGNLLEGIRVRYEESDGTLISDGETNASGVFSFSIDSGLLPLTNAAIRARLKPFEDFDQTLTIPTTGFDIPISLPPDITVNLP